MGDKITISLGKLFYTNNSRKNTVIHCSGHVFINDEVYSGQQFADYLSEKFDSDKIEDIINSIDGHFAIIVKLKNKIILIVDRSRSIPLFYSKVNDYVFISDSANQINEKIVGMNDDDAICEFKSIGYCTEEKTIISQIKQVKTGNFCQISLENNDFSFVQEEYFNYRKESSISSLKLTSKLVTELDNVFLNIFQQLIRFANGQKIVVPLSGGLDSRLIVYFLNRLNYKNVLCFTYGKPNNWESKISRNIAKRAGFEWIIIPYSRKMWNEFINSKEAKSLFNFACNLSSLPLLQDCLAVKELISVVPKNSIFVPGISADFLAGSHITQDLIKINNFSKENLIHKYLAKNNISNKKSQTSNNSFFDVMQSDTLTDFICEYENLDYNERQSKYIVNSCRIYEYYGYNWTLPFFYKESLFFWKNLELEHKIAKKLFLNYLEGRFLFEEVNFKQKSTSNFKKNPSTIFYFLKKTIKEMKNWKKIFFDYYTHPMQWYGVFNNYLAYLIFSVKNYNRETSLSLRYISFIVKKFTN